MFEKTFILNFNKSASIYKEEEKLDAPTQGGAGGGMRMMGSMMGGGGTFYKNIKEKTYTVDKEFMGKEFLIKDFSLSIVFVILIFGILLALMCGLFLHFWILTLETLSKLYQSESILRSTLNSSIDGIVVVSLDGKIVTHNTRFLEMWGIPFNDESIMNRCSLTKIVVSRLRNHEEYYLKRRQITRNLSYEGNDILELSNGNIYERHIMPHIIDDIIVGRIVSYRDVTAQKTLETELLHQSNYDPLTELPNRSLTLDLIRRAITAPGAKIHNVAIFLIDIDKFSNINDLFGRSKGDNILKMVVSRLQQQLNENSVLCRIGNDQFLVFFVQ
jgi:PAS domain S-box-containing protein